jgi:Dolichyl-phosphate-mannose-protein mannosyltransferase
MTITKRLARAHFSLVCALLLASLFCLQGIRWGRVECWNADQMALRGLRALRPGDYFKPPFHTYLNHALVIYPIQGMEALAGISKDRWNIANPLILIDSRLLVILLFLGTILLAYNFSLQCYDRFAAGAIVLILATSAGFIGYAHFLTADMPLIFWMLLAFWLAFRIVREPDRFHYGAAGFFAGIATATKYNGLAVTISLVMAHLLATKDAGGRQIIFSRNLAFGLLMVPTGFLAGCFTALYEPHKFWTQFLFNYIVTPRFEGQADRFGYLDFLKCIPEIIGLPGAIAIAVFLFVAVLVVVRRHDFDAPAAQGLFLAGSVFLFYFLKMGAFPRQQTRFALPAVLFLLLAIGPAFQRRGLAYMLSILLAPVLIYNCVCSYWVGKRFNDDPRLAAQVWLLRNVKPGNVIESSPASPHWSKLSELRGKEVSVSQPDWTRAAGADVIDLRMPILTGRAALFQRIFPNKKWVGELAAKYESDSGAWAYSLQELQRRRPSFITLYSFDFSLPNQALHKYYEDLLAEKYPYQTAFAVESSPVPTWVYPRYIDFLPGRMTIFRRKS